MVMASVVARLDLVSGVSSGRRCGLSLRRYTRARAFFITMKRHGLHLDCHGARLLTPAECRNFVWHCGVGRSSRHIRSRPSRSRVFTEAEERSEAAVCVVGETVRNTLFGQATPVGSVIRVKQFSCDVIGLPQSKGQASTGRDQDDTVIVPLTSAPSDASLSRLRWSACA